MEFYSIGPDEVYEFEVDDEVEKEKYVWTVCWYEVMEYHGCGEAITLGKDGLLYYSNLSHYSGDCAMRYWGKGCSTMTVDEFFREKDSIHDLDFREEIKVKVRSLLGK